MSVLFGKKKKKTHNTTPVLLLWKGHQDQRSWRDLADDLASSIYSADEEAEAQRVEGA